MLNTPSEQPFDLRRNTPGGIAIIDMNEGFRRACRERLEAAGFRVQVAGDDDKNWDWIQKISPEVLLLELELGNIDGFDILRRTCSHPITLHISVFVVSIFSETADIARAFSLGAAHYAMKGRTSLD